MWITTVSIKASKSTKLQNEKPCFSLQKSWLFNQIINTVAIWFVVSCYRGWYQLRWKYHWFYQQHKYRYQLHSIYPKTVGCKWWNSQITTVRRTSEVSRFHQRGRAMIRPRRAGRSCTERAYKYDTPSKGITSSCAAIWRTGSAEVNNQFTSFHLTRTKVFNNSRTWVWFISFTNDLRPENFHFSAEFLGNPFQSIVRFSNIETHDFPAPVIVSLLRHFPAILLHVTSWVAFCRYCFKGVSMEEYFQTKLSHIWQYSHRFRDDQGYLELIWHTQYWQSHWHLSSTTPLLESRTTKCTG